MTLDQLRIFVAVAEREHLTQAAVALHLTPSAVSAAVHALETRYDAHLFNRVGRRIELSDQGRLFLCEARATLASAKAAELALLELSGLHRGTLAIEASQTITSYWLPPALMRFAAAHPAITLSLAEGNTASVAAAVLDGRADLGFVEGIVDEPALSVTTIDDDRLLIVAAPSHPLAARRDVSVSDLAAARWVMREAGSGTRAAFEQALRHGGIVPETLTVVLHLPTNEAACAAVRAGDSLAVISALAARPHIEGGRLCALRYELPARSFAMLRHKERYRTKASLALEAVLHEHVRERRSLAEASFDI